MSRRTSASPADLKRRVKLLGIRHNVTFTALVEATLRMHVGPFPDD